MKIIVTGGGGYLGSALVPALLLRGHSVVAVDTPEFGNENIATPGWGGGAVEHVCDIRDIDIEQDFDAVIHLAAIASTARCEKERDLAKSIHVHGTQRVMQIPCGKRIHISTGAVYGAADGHRTENDVVKPLTVYADTKARGEDVALDAGATVLRLNNLCGYAPGTRWVETANRLAKDAVVEKHVEVWDPDVVQPFTHVLDAVTAIDTALAFDLGPEIYNVLSEVLLRRRFGEYAEHEGATSSEKLVGRARSLILKADKFAAMANWYRTCDIRDGFHDAANAARKEIQ